MLIDGEIGIDLSDYELWRQNNNTKAYSFVAPDPASAPDVKWATVCKTQGIYQQKGFVPVMSFLNGKWKRQPYHWYKPTKGTALAQAAAFLQDYIPGEYPPLLDLENSGSYIAWRGIGLELMMWINEVGNKTGQMPEIYASPSYIQSYFTPKDVWLRNCKLIIAHWGVNFPLINQPYLPCDVRGWQLNGNFPAQAYGVPNPTGFATIASASVYLRFK